MDVQKAQETVLSEEENKIVIDQLANLAGKRSNNPNNRRKGILMDKNSLAESLVNIKEKKMINELNQAKI